MPTNEDRALLAACDATLALIDRTLGSLDVTLANVDRLIAECELHRAPVVEREAA